MSKSYLAQQSDSNDEKEADNLDEVEERPEEGLFEREEVLPAQLGDIHVAQDAVDG